MENLFLIVMFIVALLFLVIGLTYHANAKENVNPNIDENFLVEKKNNSVVKCEKNRCYYYEVIE